MPYNGLGRGTFRNENDDGQIKAEMTKKQQGNEQLYMQDNGQDIMVAGTPHVCHHVCVGGTQAGRNLLRPCL